MLDAISVRTTATGCRWVPLAARPSTTGHPRLPAIVDRLLAGRGIATPDEAERFLRAELASVHDPLLLPDMPRALDRLARAIRAGEMIAVFGDFDVDGITATAILVEAIAALGGHALPYLPDRFREGYGPNAAAFSSLSAQGVGLIVTVDCGISAAAEIGHASTLGVDVIVLDHHNVPPRLPAAIAVIDPKREGCTYPWPELCAGGLAYKLAGALAAHLGNDRYDPAAHLDLAGLATVCDMVPLQDENRWLARRGLAALARTARPGLIEMARIGGFDLRAADSDLFAFRIGPRLNATGRLDHARLAYELLTTRDPARAKELALAIERLNHNRRSATARAIALVEELLADEGSLWPLVFTGHEAIPEGIVGLVAGRLAETYRLPAVVYHRGEEHSRGSVRGVPGFDVHAALQAAAPLLLRQGGHRQAGGFTVATKNLPALREVLAGIAAQSLAETDNAPTLAYDTTIDLEADADVLLKWRQFLGPFGVGNPEPLLLARDLEVCEARAVGDGTHLRLRLRAGTRVWNAIAFRLAHAAPPVGARIDALLHVRPGRNGAPDLHVRDLARC